MKHHYVTCKTANNFKLPPFPLLCYLQKEKYLKTDSYVYVINDCKVYFY